MPRALAHTKGSKRVPAYDQPLPLAWRQVEGGFQKYKLNGTPVWDRRSFTYLDDTKEGDVVGVFVERGSGSLALPSLR